MFITAGVSTAAHSSCIKECALRQPLVSAALHRYRALRSFVAFEGSRCTLFIMLKCFAQEIDGTLGSLFFVLLFSVMFYGFTCGQVMYYMTNYYTRGEPTYITTLVVLLWILDTGKTIVDIACGWVLVISTDRHDPVKLLGKLPAVPLSSLCNAAICILYGGS
ncbi:hypothetical protein C8Q72DRAFT_158919 [Fomitopsis betulina]|nr:hypothetical protein C8Q72DRAFT_158919 [Fomitopsis betulina]